MPEALPELKGLEAQHVRRPGVAFLCQLACAATGQPWSDQGLSAVEANTVHILQAMLRGTKTAALLKQAEHMALLGDKPELWHTLLHMIDRPKSAPAARLQALVDGLALAGGSAVMPYYLGVVALRKGDVQTAQSTWRLAAEAGMATPWFVENRLHLLRAQAHALGQGGRWHELIELLQAHRVTETPDAVLAEMLAVAHAHLGVAAAQAQDWSTRPVTGRRQRRGAPVGSSSRISRWPKKRWAAGGPQPRHGARWCDAGPASRIIRMPSARRRSRLSGAMSPSAMSM